MKYLMSLGVIISILFATLVPTAVVIAGPFDGSVNQACEGVSGGSGCDPAAAESQVNKTIEIAVNIFSFIVGVVAVIMIIVGGLKYITSTGDSTSVNSAKNTILYAVIGLGVVALAQVIVRFVIGKI